MPDAMPDTFSYFVAGYVIALVLYAGYLVSLWTRRKGGKTGGR